MHKNLTPKTKKVILGSLITFGLIIVSIFILLVIKDEPTSKIITNEEIPVSFSNQQKILQNFTLSIPTINTNQPSSGTISGSIKMNSEYLLNKNNDYSVSIRTNDGVEMSLSAVTADFGGGFLTYIPEYQEVTNTDLNKTIYRVLFQENNRIAEISNLFNNKNFYYYYTEALIAGKDCQVADGFSCSSENFSASVNGASQAFRFYCGVNEKDKVTLCDEVFENIRILDVKEN